MTQLGRARQASWVAVAASLVAIQLFLLIPATLYANNAQEFSAALGAVLVHLFRPALFLVALLALLAMFVGERGARRTQSLLFGLAVLLWLQGNFLVWDYGLLDGRPIDWADGAWRGWLDTSAWIAVLAAAWIAAERGRRLLMGAAVVAVVATLINAGGSVAREAGHLGGRDFSGSSQVLQAMQGFSGGSNVIQIVMDGFQSDVFREILAEPGIGAQLQNSLDGFVQFRNHLGAFPYTHMSVPAILSGKLYQNEQPIDDFLDQALAAGAPSILNAARQAGYEVDLAIPEGTLERIYARGAADNVYPLSTDLHVTPEQFAVRDAAKVFDLALFRLVPHYLKRFVYNDQLWLSQRLFVREGYMGLRYFSNMSFLHRLTEEATVDRPTPVFKMMHLMISHTPFATTRNCEYAGQVLATSRVNVLNQARCGLIEVVALIEKLKTLGIYDSSTIVLMADHGSWIMPKEFMDSVKIHGLPPALDPRHPVLPVAPIAPAMAVPVFAIKPPRSRGALRTSRAPSWIVDSAATVADAAGIPGQFPGRNALSLDEDEVRERVFSIYEYQRSDWGADYLTPIHRFSINGSVFDSAAWTERDVLQPGQVATSRSD